MSTETSKEEQPSSKRNIIVTYATLENLLKTTQRVDIKMDHLYEKMGEVREDYLDHETRLRVLERTQASASAGKGMATWMFQSIWPIAAVLISALSYLNNTP